MAYDKDKPASSTSLRSSNPEILANWGALETALNREHEFSTGGTTADQAHHKRGSARSYFQDAEPTTRVNGESFNSEDLGSLWFDTNSGINNVFSVLTATVPTWTPVSDEIIATLLSATRVFGNQLGCGSNFAVNLNKFNVQGTTGNTTIAGTLGVTGTSTLTGVATLGDSSQMATSAAPTADADLANKKYVDDQILAQVPLSARCKGWAAINGNNGDIISSFNVSGVSRNSVGDYTISWDTDFATNNYAVSVMGNQHHFRIESLSAGGMQIQSRNLGGSLADSSLITVIVFGNQ